MGEPFDEHYSEIAGPNAVQNLLISGRQSRMSDA
jgi:hypothetical protein